MQVPRFLLDIFLIQLPRNMQSQTLKKKRNRRVCNQNCVTALISLSSFFVCVRI